MVTMEPDMPKRVIPEEERNSIKLTMLEAGFPLLKEYGMTHTTVSKLTEAAGIAKGTFYHFWKNKEEYMADLISYHRKKMIPLYIDGDVLAGKRKAGRDEVKRFLLAMIDEEVSIYAHMTLEDEAKLIRHTDAFLPDPVKESAIAVNLLDHVEGVREDADLPLIANMIKIFVIAAESREELQEEAYGRTVDTLAESILDLIFE
ncbi:MAG: TetR/AcrR family transcriptional regulator [Clostridiales bacterium]|nr:TetR/AcrR family transcriptional regulator [Clostridiales bacterium]